MSKTATSGIATALPSVGQLVSSLALDRGAGGADLTQLAGVPYINVAPGGGMSVFDPGNLALALSGALEQSAPNTPAGADPQLLRRVTDAFTSVLGGKASSELTDALLLIAYMVAGRDAFVELLARRVSGGNGGAPVPEDTRTGAAAKLHALFNDVLARLARDGGGTGVGLQADWRDTAVATHAGTLPTDHGVVVSQLQRVVGDSMAALLPASGSNDNALLDYLASDRRAAAAMVEVAFAPVVAVLSVASIQRDTPAGGYDFTTKAYAAYALTQMAGITLQRLANACAPGGTRDGLINVRNAVLQRFDGKLDMASVNTGVKDVMRSSLDARARSADAARLGAGVSERVSRNADMQTEFNADARDVTRLRWTFLAWLFALVAVLAASCGLIAASRLTAFVLLAASTLLVVIVDRTARMLWNRRAPPAFDEENYS